MFQQILLRPFLLLPRLFLINLLLCKLDLNIIGVLEEGHYRVRTKFVVNVSSSFLLVFFLLFFLVFCVSWLLCLEITPLM